MKRKIKWNFMENRHGDFASCSQTVRSEDQILQQLSYLTNKILITHYQYRQHIRSKGASK